MARLLLVRHAQSVWNAAGRWQGWADPPLSEDGERQATAGAESLAGLQPAAIVSSDLRRAHRTAQLLAAGRPVAVDPDLREYDAGAWTGLTRVEIEQAWPGLLAAWDAGDLRRAPGGEDPDGFADRVQRGLRRAAAVPEPATVLVVTHSGVIWRLARLLGGAVRGSGHLTGAVVEVPGGGAPLRLAGEVALLRPPPVPGGATPEGGSAVPPPPLRSLP